MMRWIALFWDAACQTASLEGAAAMHDFERRVKVEVKMVVSLLFSSRFQDYSICHRFSLHIPFAPV